MNENKPVAWIDPRELDMAVSTSVTKHKQFDTDIPLYTHPTSLVDWSYQQGYQVGKETHPAKTLTDEEIESWITEWAKDLYGTLYVEPTDHQRTMAIKMARAILRKAQEK